MIRALDLKNLSNNTKRAYLTAVTGLAKHYRQSPEKITATMIEDYLLYLKNEKGNAPASCSSALSGKESPCVAVLKIAGKGTPRKTATSGKEKEQKGTSKKKEEGWGSKIKNLFSNPKE